MYEQKIKMRRGIDMIGDADVCGITVIAVTITDR